MNFPKISFKGIAKNVAQLFASRAVQTASQGKTITAQDVVRTANELITANGSTTTLDVKRKLRQKGMRIKQKEVSIIMTSKTKEYQWDCTFNGIFKTYYPS